MFRIGRNTFCDHKNKIPKKIPEFKRSGIGLIVEFRGIPNGFPNQVAYGKDLLKYAITTITDKNATTKM
jgi:hypothetical protein